MSYSIEDLENALEQSGELLVTFDSDAYDGPVELHLHDTEFISEPEEVIVHLADGKFSFLPESVESLAQHEQSLSDIGLE